MGYYSTVGICLYKKDFEEMKSRVRNLICGNDLFNYAELRMFEANEGEPDDVVAIKWDWIKWYPTFPEIDCVMTFIEQLDDCYYVRIGEDMTDTEEWLRGDNNGFMDRIGLVREIEFFD